MNGHSPLGFSGAERYMNCPGSVALIQSLPTETAIESEPEYREAGVRAHEAWAHCLREGMDAWEVADRGFDAGELAAGQTYLDFCRQLRSEFGVAGEAIEIQIHAPEVHELAWGTLDYVLVGGGRAAVVDYKHGEGVFVEAEHNPQLMGYGALALHRWSEIEWLDLCIVQPRCGEPVVRHFEISAEDLRGWVYAELQPAMRRAAEIRVSEDRSAVPLSPGPWCRFCPAKLTCPALTQLPAEVESLAPLVSNGNTFMSDQRLGELYQKIEPLQIAIRAIRDEVQRRALLGITGPWKLVQKKADRVWKTDAPHFVFEEDAYEKRLKSPAQIEKDFGSRGKTFCKQWAYTPDAGMTVAPLSDRRHAVELPKTAAQRFGNRLTEQENSDT